MKMQCPALRELVQSSSKQNYMWSNQYSAKKIKYVLHLIYIHIKNMLIVQRLYICIYRSSIIRGAHRDQRQMGANRPQTYLPFGQYRKTTSAMGLEALLAHARWVPSYIIYLQSHTVQMLAVNITTNKTNITLQYNSIMVQMSMSTYMVISKYIQYIYGICVCDFVVYMLF